MTKSNEMMPQEIYLIRNPELEVDEDSHVIWTTDIDCYPDHVPEAKYIRADIHVAAAPTEVTVDDLVQQIKNTLPISGLQLWRALVHGLQRKYPNGVKIIS